MERSSGVSSPLVIALVLLGAVIGGGLVQYWSSSRSTTTAAQTAKPAAPVTDVDRLKTLVPSQSHSMMDVGYHWTNLWFAGKKKNWALAEFFFNETRQHIQWTIRIRPVRRDPEGRDVNLVSIFEAADTSLFTPVKTAILEHDASKFEATYKASLEGCYACHKASGKPFLHPVVPSMPTQAILDFEPLADVANP